MPLIAFAIFAFGPSALTPIAYILSLLVHLSSFGGLPPRPPDPITLLLEPPILTIALWPFLALYGTTRGKLIEQPDDWRSLRLATIGATLAISLPGAVLLVGVPFDLVSPARDAGEGTGFLCLFFMVLLWIPGRHRLADRSRHRLDAAFMTTSIGRWSRDRGALAHGGGL